MSFYRVASNKRCLGNGFLVSSLVGAQEPMDTTRTLLQRRAASASTNLALLCWKCASFMIILAVKVISMVIKLMWNSSSHPVIAYIWIKVGSIIWALVLTQIAEIRCKGTDSITNPECQIIIHAQSTTLHDIHDSNFVAFLSLVRMLGARSVASFGHASALAFFAAYLRDGAPYSSSSTQSVHK